MSPDKRSRLSVLRVLIALVVIGGVVAGGAQVAQRAIAMTQGHDSASVWFAPYVDVTLPPYFDFQDPVANPNMDVVLAFIVGSPQDPCAPSWGGFYGLDQAAAQLDLDRRIARLRQRGGDVVVSFGGLSNQELSVACTDPAKLAAAYSAVITRYALTAIDLDLEGSGLDDTEASARRTAAIAQVQSEAHAAGRQLDVWLTLPLAPAGLQSNAVAAIDGMLDAKVDLAGVNIMAMDYGAGRPADTDFVTASLQGLDAAARQLTSSYLRVGVTFAPSAVFAKLGVTPMIGQNDSLDDRLSPADARRLFDESSRRGVSRVSMWSLNRDAQCGGNIDRAIANNLCSGVDQAPLEFSAIFRSATARPTTTTPERNESLLGGRAPVDSRTTPGPYAQWRPRREYEADAKVVWDGEVYQAKWWNKGAQPDAAVKHEWDSPWRVLGPVLADDEAPPTTVATLPPGTFPAWDPDTIYKPGDRVQHLGVGYRDKWWSRGDDPAADVDNPWESPWEPVGASAPAKNPDPPAVHK